MRPLDSGDPSRIGAYRLLGRLGEGGMGRVYLGRSGGGRTVAVKAVRDEIAQVPEFRRRFAREVAAAQRVGGSWTAAVLDADTDAAVPWVATQYIPGPDLRTVVAEDFGPLPEYSVRVLANRLALALQAVHDAGLIHRDLKPTNILVTADGPRVIDFGIARALGALEASVPESAMTRTGMVVGSPGFMSPEQAREGELTPASDVFCLGSVLTYAATGRGPFGADGSGGFAAQLFRVVEAEPDVAGVPASLVDLVRACLDKDPRHRPTPGEVAEQTADGSAEPWLPGVLLQQLGRRAAELLDYDPAPAAPAALTSAGVPEAARTSATARIAAPPHAAIPAPPVQPPGVPAPPAPRRSRIRMVIAGTVAVAVVAAGIVALKPWDDDHDKNTGSGQGGSGTGVPTGVTVPSDFEGTWEGQLFKWDPLSRERLLRIEIQPGSDKVNIWMVEAERFCALESTALRVEETDYEGTHLTLGEPRIRQGNPVSKQDGCTQDPIKKLTFQSDTLSWEVGGQQAQFQKKPEMAKQQVPDTFTGTHVIDGEDRGFSRDGLVQLKTIDIEAGTVYTTPVAVGVLVGEPGKAVQCFYRGNAFLIQGDHLFTTPLVSVSSPGTSPCPEFLPAQQHNARSGDASVSVTSLGGQGVSGSVRRPVP